MSRYIDADKLHEKIIDKQVLAIYEDWDFNTVRDIRKTINEIPTADVEPVRHCKDCSYFCNDGIVTYCNLFGAIMENDDFCSCFEAKMDGKETGE